MKKLFCLLLAALFLLPTVGCARPKIMFELAYELERSDYYPGETIKITASVTNPGPEDYVYTGFEDYFIPEAKLVHRLSDGGEYVLNYCNKILIDGIPEEVRIKPGQTGSYTYEFMIPNDAPVGKYSLDLSYGGVGRVFPDVVSILSVGSQKLG